MKPPPYFRADARGCVFCMASKDVADSLRQDLRELQASAAGAVDAWNAERAALQRRISNLSAELGELRATDGSQLAMLNLITAQRDHAWRENVNLRAQLNRHRDGAAG